MTVQDDSSKTTETPSHFLDFGLRNLLRGTISLGVVIYVIGFVIVNANYAIYGVTDYQLVQTRYIGAGLNYLFTHLGIAAMIAIVVLSLEKSAKIVWFTIFFVLWGALAVPSYLANQSVFSSIVVGFNAIAISLVGYVIWASWKRSLFERIQRSFSSYGFPEESLTVFIAFGLVILVGISTISWGWSFWPATSSVFGGGRPNEVILTFDVENLPEEGLPFVPMQNDFVSEQLPILFERPSEFVVLVEMPSTTPDSIEISNLTAVRISKSIVLSVIFARSSPFKSGQRQAIPTVPPSITPMSTPTP